MAGKMKHAARSRKTAARRMMAARRFLSYRGLSRAMQRLMMGG